MLNTMALGVAPYAAVQTQWFHALTAKFGVRGLSASRASSLFRRREVLG
jgi:hypothetical protein